MPNFRDSYAIRHSITKYLPKSEPVPYDPVAERALIVKERRADKAKLARMRKTLRTMMRSINKTMKEYEQIVQAHNHISITYYEHDEETKRMLSLQDKRIARYKETGERQ